MAEMLLLEDVPFDELMIEEDEGEEAVKPAPAQGVPDLEMTPAPRHPAAALAKANPPATPATPPPAATATEAPAPEAPASDDAHDINLDLERYARKHQRYPVDWLATLRNDSVVAAVRVFDISAASLGIECSEPFEIGQSLTLVFDQLPQRPTASVTVMRKIKRGFVLEGEIQAPIIAAASNANRPAGARLAG
jgi:pyruvate/2-oxoglutarate dehydrogenase complex dihydrolipoamide acyltransferase (E2) component